MTKIEKLNLLKSISQGETEAIKKIKNEITTAFIKTLSTEELNFLIDNENCFPDREISFQEIKDILNNGIAVK